MPNSMAVRDGWALEGLVHKQRQVRLHMTASVHVRLPAIASCSALRD